VTQLGIWRFTEQGPQWNSFYIPGALLMLGGALLIGGLAAFPAAGRGAGRWGVTISGLAGPAVLAASYALASPRPGHATFEQLSALYTAPYMMVAGLIGSGLVAAVGSGPRRPPKRKPRIKSIPAADTQSGAPAAPPGLTPSPGRRSEPLPAPSAGAVRAKASVPAQSRVELNEWPPR
jgi:hypothetical protein